MRSTRGDRRTTIVGLVTGATGTAGRGIGVELGCRGATVYTAGDLARSYGFTDIDGAQPKPFGLD